VYEHEASQFLTFWRRFYRNCVCKCN